MSLNMLQVFILLVSVISIAAQEILSVNLNIDGREFGVKFPTSISALAVAQQFCIEQATTLGVVQETLAACIAPVEKFLSSAISDDIRKKAVNSMNDRNVQVKLRVNEIDYEITFQPSAVSIEAVANEFCTEKSQELGVTQETLSACIAQINAYVLQQLKSYVETNTQTATAQNNDELMRVPLRIGDREYTVEFIPMQTTPNQIATQFCIEVGASLGFTNENIGECISPVQSYLTQVIDDSVDSSQTRNRMLQVSAVS
jgi:hypothetical protein